LLIVYVCSRIYLHNPPGENDDLCAHPNAPASFKADVDKLREEEPVVNPFFCIVVLTITVVLLGVTSEFLVRSVKPMRTRGILRQEFFGMVLLPLVSYSADGILSVVYFARHHIKAYRKDPTPILPAELAQGRSIDLRIQFLLFWMPLLVLMAWISQKPLSLLFDVFEVAVLLGACFLVNQVTADSKTNWAEGMMMVTLYAMIATATWFYPGQTDVQHMLSCGSVEDSLAAPPKGGYVFSQKPLTNQTQLVVKPESNDNQVLNQRLQKILKRHGVLADEGVEIPH